MSCLFLVEVRADADSNRCVRASLFGSFGQLDGDAGIVAGTDQVKIVYTRNADAISWTQYVLFHLNISPQLTCVFRNVTNAVTGAYLSSYEHESGPMTG